jgi:hypothetical protein
MNQYIKPAIVEVKSKDWVLNGQYNSFYKYIIDRYNGSSTNAAIINSYVDLIYGQGLQNTNGSIEDWMKFRKMISPEEIRKIVSDFEMFGEATMQIIKANGSDKLPYIYHLPKDKTAPKKVNDDDEIEGYYYSEDWKKANTVEPDFFPMLDPNSSEAAMCFAIRPYKAGKKYFSDPDYLAGLQYAELEEEISNYYISHIKNGLSFGYIINIPDGNSYTPEEKDEMERKIKQKLVGSTQAGKFIINFNGRDEAITVTALEVNDAHRQWEYLTGEARQQLLTAHRVTSPMLFGIKDSTGLGNNADELDTAEAQLMKRVIAPKQRYLLDAFETVAAAFGINLDLRFKPITDTDQLSSMSFSDMKIDSEQTELDRILESYAQDAPDGYDLYATEYDLQFSAIAKSEQDTDLWKVRYAYSVGTSKTPKGKSRNFCNKMISLAEQGKVYRKEDIDQMSADGVNGEFAHSGGKYDIFLYAGGVNCYHRWERRIYKKRRQEDGQPFGGNALQNTFPVSVNDARRQGFAPPQNPADVAIAEIDKPNNGRYPG